LAFAAGFAVTWIFQSAAKAAAFLTALLVLAVVAAFVAWRHHLMPWAVAASVAALYAMAMAGGRRVVALAQLARVAVGGISSRTVLRM